MSDIKDILQQFINQIPQYAIEIGVFSGKSKRKVKVGLTNAELMFIHENGSPLHNIPARPVLKMTIDYAKTIVDKTLNKAVEVYFEQGDVAYENELKRFCLKLENYARKLIYDNNGQLIANAPSTIKRKGYNHPLFQTGQLARSITCQLIKL